MCVLWRETECFLPVCLVPMKGTMSGLLKTLRSLPQGRGEEWGESRERVKESERRRRRRSEVGGVWLPSTCSLASLPFGLSHHFYYWIRGQTSRSAQDGPAFTPWVSNRVCPRCGNYENGEGRVLRVFVPGAFLFFFFFTRTQRTLGAETHKTIKSGLGCSVAVWQEFRSWRIICQQRVRNGTGVTSCWL